MKIAILSDIHAVSGAYRLALAAAEREGFDALVILGDLLTYGVSPAETLELTQEAIERHSAKLLLGNHDQMYLEARSGTSAYAERLPEWIRESFEWTNALAGGSGLWQSADWLDELPIGDLLISHANPFGAGDWTYLNSPDAMQRACETLNARGFRWGVFGHVHRFRSHEDMASGTRAVTVGSIGQPREPGGVSQWAMAELSEDGFTIAPRPVAFDWGEEISAVNATTLSQQTKERIVKYFA